MAIKRRHKKYFGKQKHIIKKRILIVCEGKVTEPTYFYQLKQQEHLQSITVKVESSKYSDPASVFKTAQKMQQKEKNKGGEYDKIYCVFDEDGRSKNKGQKVNFEKTCRDIKNKENFEMVLSTPSIEYWFLLHFIYYCDPCSTDFCEQKLKSKDCLGKYNKSIDKKDFKKLWNNLEIAKKNAHKAMERVGKTGEYNPSTEIHLLIEELEKRAEEEKAD